MPKKNNINWCVLGTGKAANNIVKALLVTNDVGSVSVCSREKVKAKEFAKKYNLHSYFSSHNHLAKSIDIDIVYIATPNACHVKNALTFIRSGKNVLIEKPFATNFNDVKKIFDTAKKFNVFVMEAMWTKFIPAYKSIENLINSGEIGKLVSFQASLGQSSIANKDNNLFREDMGGGAILDLGVYPIFWAYQFFGFPESVYSSCYSGDTNVDLTSSIIMNYKNGRNVSIVLSIIERFSNVGTFYGTEGKIEISEPLYCPTSIVVTKYKKSKFIHSHESLKSKITNKIKSSFFFNRLYINHLSVIRLLLRVHVNNRIKLPIKGNGLQYMTSEVTKYLISKDRNNSLVNSCETMNIYKMVERIKKCEQCK